VTRQRRSSIPRMRSSGGRNQGSKYTKFIDRVTRTDTGEHDFARVKTRFRCNGPGNAKNSEDEEGRKPLVPMNSKNFNGVCQRCRLPVVMCGPGSA
jgi:hypothetical protein